MYPGSEPNTVARLMARFRGGDKAAAHQLVELFYPELRRMAAARMKGERTEHTWQPTVLVNELYLVLVKIKSLGGDAADNDQEKAAFLGLSGQIMKRLLIDHARPLYRHAVKVQFQDRPDSSVGGVENLQQVKDALSRLAAIDPNFRTIVEMKVFGGLTGDEIANELGCSPRTVATYWNFARRWLEKELSDSS